MMAEKKPATDVENWIEMEDEHTKEALENASRHFDDTDSLTVTTLEAIYGRESSFGENRRERNISGAAGDFQLEKNTAQRLGLTVSSENDQRFDINDASAAAARYLKKIDGYFSKETTLTEGLKTSPVADAAERKKFIIAAYNAGEGRIAKAQEEAKKAGKKRCTWDDVKNYLKEAGASDDKVKEIQEYVEKVLEYEQEFDKKSKADKSIKNKMPMRIKKESTQGHWITKNGRQIFIED